MHTTIAIEGPVARPYVRPERLQRNVADDEAGTWSARLTPRSEGPLNRVAALLVSISHNNTYEGRDPTEVPDVLTSGFVAGLLDVDIGTLAALLLDLKRRGLIESDSSAALRLKDVPALESLAHSR